MDKTLTLPTQINNYELISMISSDAYSITYHVKNSTTSQAYVVEEFFPQFLVTRNNNGDIELKNEKYAPYFTNGKNIFIQDFKAMRSIKNPSINSPLELFEENETLYKVFPFKEYAPLSAPSKLFGTQQNLINFIKPLADALKSMHEKNIHHGELHLKNIAKHVKVKSN